VRIFAIDPGTTESGYVLYEDGKVLQCGVSSNEHMLHMLALLPIVSSNDMLAVEMVASFGMAVGAEIFETVLWTGRFIQAWVVHHPQCSWRKVYRMEVKMHLCHSPKAKDPNIRQALIDKLGAPGKKSAPGPTFGVTSHAWPALGVAVVAAETPMT
jgi:hypothetical protein